MTVQVIPESPDQLAEIQILNTTAFDGRTEEADLVDALRESGELLVSLVATSDGRLAGHVAFSRVIIDTVDGPVGGAALAPVSVHPDFQATGVGSSLINAGLELLSARGEQVVLVVGNPTYYSRFGFSSAAATRYPSLYSGPHFMALVIGDPAAAPIGPVSYPEAFELVN